MIEQPDKPFKKLKANWSVGSEFLPPNTIEQSANNVLLGDRTFGDGKMTLDEAKKLVRAYRKKVKNVRSN